MPSSNEKMNQDSGFKDLISSCEKLAQEVIVKFIKEEYEDKPTLRETQKSSDVDFLSRSEATDNDLLTTVESAIAGKIFTNKLFQDHILN